MPGKDPFPVCEKGKQRGEGPGKSITYEDGPVKGLGKESISNKSYKKRPEPEDPVHHDLLQLEIDRDDYPCPAALFEDGIEYGVEKIIYLYQEKNLTPFDSQDKP